MLQTTDATGVEGHAWDFRNGAGAKGKRKRLQRASTVSKRPRIFSPHAVDLPTSSDLPHEPTSSDIEDFEERDDIEEAEGGADEAVSDDEDLQPQFMFMEEKLPRDRDSKSKPERDAMIAAHVSVDNHLAPAPRKGYTCWRSWVKAYEAYCATNHVGFRTRTSKSVEVYNRKYNVHLSERRFYRSFVNYRCKHGVHQQRRGAGKRNTDVNFTGCLARFNVVLVNITPPRGRPRHRLIVKDEWRTHNYSTEHAGTAARVEDVPTEGPIADTVSMLHENSVRCSQIAGYLSEQIGLPVSSQLARNFMRKLQREATAQGRLKVLLDTLSAEDGCEVIVIRDQMDVTCAIVVQSAVQKVAFEQWGESMALDWTHGTNNVGYHLGSFVVTTPTGRGFPVLDFMSLNEKAVTLERIFEFFKETNSTWRKIQSFVIDKHFVEWQVLETCFPSATVLLCQFHAIMYWKKLLTRKFHLSVADQDTIQCLFAKMLYSNTAAAFERTYNEFCAFCDGSKKVIRQYFDRNWKECRGMWANYLRNTVFSAGNTTTNRIESNWHLLKMLLGKKTAVDQAVASVLRHQANIARQFLQAVHRHNCRSRNPDTVPVFLRRAAAVMSEYVLGEGSPPVGFVHGWNEGSVL